MENEEYRKLKMGLVLKKLAKEMEASTEMNRKWLRRSRKVLEEGRHARHALRMCSRKGMGPVEPQ